MKRLHASIAALAIAGPLVAVGVAGTAVATGGHGQKVTVCHVPPGNPANAHTIEVSVHALSAHLAHGDVEGACVVVPTDEPTTEPTDEPTVDPTPTDEPTTEPPVTEPPVTEPPVTVPPVVQPPVTTPEPPSVGTPIGPIHAPSTQQQPAQQQQTYPAPYCLGVALVTETAAGKSYDNGNPACAGEDSREEGF